MSTPQNDFLPFASSNIANVETQADYATDAQRENGNTNGSVASSALNNKALRQSSIVTAMIASFIADQTGANVIDDGTIATIELNFKAAIQSNGAKFATFITDGGWICPAGVTTAYLSGVAAGGGGGASGSNNTANSAASNGGGGGAGQSVIRRQVSVVPGQTYAVTLGIAGAGGPAPSQGAASTSANNGMAGGSTSFGSLLTLAGGSGGTCGAAGAPGGIAIPGGNGGTGFPNGGFGSDGAPAPALNTIPAWPGVSGSGASSPFGGGGGSVRSANSIGISGVSAGGFGAGGSGGGGPYGAGSGGGAGGGGSPGFLTVEL